MATAAAAVSPTRFFRRFVLVELVERGVVRLEERGEVTSIGVLHQVDAFLGGRGDLIDRYHFVFWEEDALSHDHMRDGSGERVDHDSIHPADVFVIGREHSGALADSHSVQPPTSGIPDTRRRQTRERKRVSRLRRV